jgi:cytochrome c
MRNWIQAVHLDANGNIVSIEPFLQEMHFRKPIELKLAPDHTLWVIESGEKWMFNTDSQIIRLGYRRGNRPPMAVAQASPLAGRQPLRIRFDARRSLDKDGDELRYLWKFGTNQGAATSIEAAPEFTFEKPGVQMVTLTATDPHGASNSVRLEIRVGNSPPQVTLAYPKTGSFYDPGQKIPYRISVRDVEDGDTDEGTILPARVLLETKTSQHAAVEDDSTMHPGLKLMRATTCFGCHITTDKSVGPPYLEVSKKYLGDPGARERLAQKILSGGIGVWGKEVPMPPHPQHTIEQTRQMVDWVLSLATARTLPALPGLTGTLTAPDFRTAFGFSASPPVFTLTASYNDNGAQGVPPLRGEAVAVLHPRRKRAAAFDAAQGVELVDVFEGGEGNVAQLAANGWFTMANLLLDGITRLIVRAAPVAAGSCELSVHLAQPDGPLLGRQVITNRTGRHLGFDEFTIAIEPLVGLHTLCFVGQPVRESRKADAVPLPSSGRILNVNWIEFRNDLQPATASK